MDDKRNRVKLLSGLPEVLHRRKERSRVVDLRPHQPRVQSTRVPPLPPTPPLIAQPPPPTPPKQSYQPTPQPINLPKPSTPQVFTSLTNGYQSYSSNSVEVCMKKILDDLSCLKEQFASIQLHIAERSTSAASSLHSDRPEVNHKRPEPTRQPRSLTPNCQPRSITPTCQQRCLAPNRRSRPIETIIRPVIPNYGGDCVEEDNLADISMASKEYLSRNHIL